MIRSASVDFGGIDLGWVLVSLLVLLFSLSLHESAHAWMAERLGDPTGRMLGRVTLNPLPHIDPMGTLLFPVVGLIAGGFIFGWAKPVPVNTARLRDPRRHHIWVAAAGPLSNIVAAAGFLVGFRLVQMFSGPGMSSTLLEPLGLVCQAGIFLNVILAVFNLIPIPPLDGSWILGGLLPGSASRWMDMIRPYGFLLLLLLLYTGAVGKILLPVMGFVRLLAY